MGENMYLPEPRRETKPKYIHQLQNLQPLDGPWGLGRNVICNAIHTRYFVSDAGGDLAQNIRGEVVPIRNPPS